MPTKIEWCDETINPLGHGCYGPGGTKEKPNVCSYCYARASAKRNLRGCELCKQFIPHTHFEQLEKLRHWKKPRKIFMQSMGDLFGEWVPDEWIQEVFKACEAAPQHRYLFLTKNPGRYCQFNEQKKSKFWLGASARNHVSAYHAMNCLHSTNANTFLSLEPLHDYINLDCKYIERIDWVIVGAETGNRKGKVIPRREWIETIVEECSAVGVPVFMKDSLARIWGEELIREYPW